MFQSSLLFSMFGFFWKLLLKRKWKHIFLSTTPYYSLFTLVPFYTSTSRADTQKWRLLDFYLLQKSKHLNTLTDYMLVSECHMLVFSVPWVFLGKWKVPKCKEKVAAIVILHDHGPRSSSLQLLAEDFLYSRLPHHNRVMKISLVMHVHVWTEGGTSLSSKSRGNDSVSRIRDRDPLEKL